MIIIIFFCRRINMVGDFANNFGSYVLLSEVFDIYGPAEKSITVQQSPSKTT